MQGTSETTRQVPRLPRRAALRMGGVLLAAAAGTGLLAACAPSAQPAPTQPAPTKPTEAAKPAATAAQQAPAKAPEPVSLRLGWLANAQYAGEFAAVEKGWYKERGIDLRIDPGGPNIDPVSLTASGSNTIGNVSSMAVLFLARSQGLPIKAFATALQRHPFAFITLQGKGINSPTDFVGKKIGIQATARPLMDAVIAKYQLPRDQVQIQNIGSDAVPLMTGQVDVITGWVINAGQLMGDQTAQMKALLLWDMGIRLYAFTYFTTDDVFKNKPEMLANFVDASGRGWDWAASNPEEATDISLKFGKDLSRPLELDTWKREAPFLWSDTTKQQGWGWMEPQVWDEAIKVYADLDQLKAPVTSGEVMTQDILRRVGSRPKR